MVEEEELLLRDDAARALMDDFLLNLGIPDGVCSASSLPRSSAFSGSIFDSSLTHVKKNGRYWEAMRMVKLMGYGGQSLQFSSLWCTFLCIICYRSIAPITEEV